MKQALSLLIVGTGLLAMSCFTASQNTAVPVTAPAQFKRILDSTYVTGSGCRVERFRIYSPSMERDVKAVAVLPPAYQADPGRKFPVLYTLHGRGAPYDTWAEMSLLQAQLKDKPFIYTCFDGDDHSQYVDAKYPVVTARENVGDSTKRKSLFTTFFFNEFVPAVDAWYRVDAAKRGLTGFSMGGGGALTYGLAKPEMFTSISVLSNGISRPDTANNQRHKSREAMLGTREENPAAYAALDHRGRLAELKQKGIAVPALYIDCGTEDQMVERARTMKTYLDSLGIPVEYHEGPGAHNWAFWHPAAVGVAEFHWQWFQSGK
jgi:S-formylglutathione hydrolase FrmB